MLLNIKIKKMGKAIVIPGVSFASLGMGQVTRADEGYVVVEGDNVVIGTQYEGLTSSVSAVDWSIDSEDYATIDSTTGKITIKPNAFGQEITVRATKSGSQSNYGEKAIKVYYSTQDTAVFDEVSVVDVTSNLRDGSPGNPSNAYRVCPINTLAINGHTHMLITTSRANTQGCQYYVSVQLSKVTANTPTSSQFSNSNADYICEMGTFEGITGGPQNAPMTKLLPLTKDSSFEYGYNSKTASGSDPVSFAYNIQEGTDTYYSSCNNYPLRTTSFSGETITIHMFK